MNIKTENAHKKLYLSYCDSFPQICIGKEAVNYSMAEITSHPKLTIFLDSIDYNSWGKFVGNLEIWCL